MAGPETANNAVTGTAMIPLLALGIPSIPATAILLSALTIHGVQPGPLLLTDHPEVFWSLVASMYIGNIILLDSQPAAGRHLREPAAHSLCLARSDHPDHLHHRRLQRELPPRSTSGSWSSSGAAGYVLRKFGYEMAPMLLALVLGDRLEASFRLALTMSGGNYATFADHASVLVVTTALALLLGVQALAWLFGYRKTVADEAESGMTETSVTTRPKAKINAATAPAARCSHRDRLVV